eukprot:Cvel_28663.t1-p1 / transcript=Cvel_28663.t1 / gene=Cvel_28663 / organism=Chromera_velia_CCMP2878 / gene_product=Cell division cycle protein 20 homolog, putative / transcript_product=Cell division cycle protein 20 homolog, putative / location=Cvel_scaffold3794:11610-14024(+) / protein_length=427 / sequence_SO=supercontig / SO=protein_coding / is_pseudo=false
MGQGRSPPGDDSTHFGGTENEDLDNQSECCQKISRRVSFDTAAPTEDQFDSSTVDIPITSKPQQQKPNSACTDFKVLRTEAPPPQSANPCAAWERTHQEKQDSLADLMGIAAVEEKLEKSGTPTTKLQKDFGLTMPSLQNDFHAHLIDWSVQDRLAVGTKSSVHFVNVQTQEVKEAFELPAAKSGNSEADVSVFGPPAPPLVSALKWSRDKPSLLAVGTSRGDAVVFDAAAGKKLRTIAVGGLGARVMGLDWHAHLLASAGTFEKGQCVGLHDVRVKEHLVGLLGGQAGSGHIEPVCGLAFESVEGRMVASGGKDCCVAVWDVRASVGNVNSDAGGKPLMEFKQHQSSVKALAWSPFKRGILATGGGMEDRTVKVWDTQESLGSKLKADLGVHAQVAGLFWAFRGSLVVAGGYGEGSGGLSTQGALQ